MTDAEAGHVTRVLRTLELLAERPRGATELADELGVHPRTARRVLRRLVDAGYAATDDGRSYALTLKLVALAGNVAERTDLVRLAAPYVARLRNDLGEAAHLCVPRESGVMHLLQESADSTVSVSSRLGELVPYHSTAVGKAMLAHLERRWTGLFEHGLERRTEHTLVGPAEILLELTAIRDRGYATDDREDDLELRCCAAPVFDDRGEVVGAIGVSVPASRLPPERFPEIGATVAAEAQALSAALGHHGPGGRLVAGGRSAI